MSKSLSDSPSISDARLLFLEKDTWWTEEKNL